MLKGSTCAVTLAVSAPGGKSTPRRLPSWWESSGGKGRSRGCERQLSHCPSDSHVACFQEHRPRPDRSLLSQSWRSDTNTNSNIGSWCCSLNVPLPKNLRNDRLATVSNAWLIAHLPGRVTRNAVDSNEWELNSHLRAKRGKAGGGGERRGWGTGPEYESRSRKDWNVPFDTGRRAQPGAPVSARWQEVSLWEAGRGVSYNLSFPLRLSPTHFHQGLLQSTSSR